MSVPFRFHSDFVMMHGGLLLELNVMADSVSGYDLINVGGPLTVETILRTLQQRFNDGHCYVSEHSNYINPCIVLKTLFL